MHCARVLLFPYGKFTTNSNRNIQLGIQEARVADAVSALPFTTEFQVKPGRTGL